MILIVAGVGSTWLRTRENEARSSAFQMVGKWIALCGGNDLDKHWMDQAATMLHPDAEQIAGMAATDIVEQMGDLSRGAHATGGSELRNDARLGKMRVVNVRGGDLNVDLGVVGEGQDARIVVLRGLRAKLAPAIQTVEAPNLFGMEAGAARGLLRRLGLNCREGGVRGSEEIAAGGILAQDPAAGREVKPDSTVTVVLSEGPTSAAVVPNVTDMSLAQAQRNLEAAGLASGEVRKAHSANVPAGYVVNTLPASEARVVRGTAVDLVVSLGPQPVGQPRPR